MRNTVNNYVEKFKQERRKRRRTYGLLLALALVVTAGIWWQLHSTGIAMTNETYCGMEEHQHDESCYERVLICGLEESEGASDTSEDVSEISEDAPEAAEVHIHDASCYETVRTLVCDLEETEGVSETTEGHTHSDDCYEDEQVLICGLEETGNVSEAYEALTETEEEQTETTEGHIHTEDCYETRLICGLEEHTHTIECMSDESADVETADDWKDTLPDDLTGVWADDVVSIALSQLDYSESTANFTLADDGETRQGYTRYGAWYGNAYGNWDAMFASFCLYYAGVDEDVFPEASGAYAWTAELDNLDLYVDAADYTPASGDLVFFDTDADGKADRVGIVTALNEAEDNAVVCLTVVEGDCTVDGADVVAQNQYELSDGTIMGFGILPEQEETEQTTVSSGTLTYEGEDYTVTVTYDEDAEIPEDAELIVSEYEADSDEWLERYEEAAALYALITIADETAGDESADADASEKTAEDGTAADAEYGFRLFSIMICADGQEITPAAEVYVSITVDADEKNPYTVICFNEESAAEAETESVIADSAQTVSFTAESLGDYALINTAAETDDADQTPVTLTFEGEDYIVTVVYGADAELPDGTQLEVSEYETDSETWQSRYAEAEELYGWNTEKTYDFRLFNIALVADGEEVEPAAEVQVTISILDKEELTEYTVTHYGEEETETMDAVSEYADGTQSVSFGTDGFSLYSLTAAGTTDFTVEYYAYLDVVQTGTSGTLALLDTSADANNEAAQTPSNTTTNAKTYITLEQNASGQYQIVTTSELTKIYKSETDCNVEENHTVDSVNKLRDNSGYTLQQVWVSTDSGTSWTKYNYVDGMEFTNEQSSAGSGIIYISDGDLVRLVYNTEDNSTDIAANLYDYDVSSNGTNVDAKGINSSSNYSVTGTYLAFGNDNVGTGLGQLLWNGNLLNMYNTGSDYGCTFGLVYDLSNGKLVYSEGVSAPNLFNDGSATGKTSYEGQNLTFTQVGDTYTLSSVSGSNGISASNLQYFTLLQNYVYDNGSTSSFGKDIYTNNFWPVDNVNSSNRKDPLFGDSDDYTYGTNTWSGVSNSTGNKTTGRWPISDDSQDHNSYFGMQFAVDFELDGDYVGPLNYYFFGDDDMWVFLTNNDTGVSTLVCDIGGVHSSVGEYVNLWDYIDSSDSAGSYTLTFFYTERGASGSTCYMQFTLPSVTSATTVQNTGSLKVEKEVDSDEVNGTETFDFTLKLEDNSGNALSNSYTYYLYNTDGTHSTGKIQNGGTFTLKDGQYILVEYLPVGTQCTVTETTTGYTTYYTVGSGSLTEGTAGSGSITNGGTLTMKFVNSTPDVEKKVKDSDGDWVDYNTASIGDNVQFKTTISDVSGVTGLVLHDVLDNGLTDPYVSGVQIVSVAADGTETVIGYLTEGTDYTLTYYEGARKTADSTDGCSFEIKFEDSVLSSLETSYVIVVEYRATLTEDAVVGSTGYPSSATDTPSDGNQNKTGITYDGKSTADWDYTYTYTFQIDILKYYEDKKLSGAEFVLYYEDTVTGAEGGGTTTVKKYACATEDSSQAGIYTLTGWTNDNASATTLTSNSSGRISVLGLAPGTYYLKETKAPDGYTLLSDPVEIIVGSNGTVTYTVDGATVNASTTDNQVKVENKPGYELPLTGGTGTYPYAMAGMLLTGGAAYLLYRSMRRRKEYMAS